MGTLGRDGGPKWGMETPAGNGDLLEKMGTQGRDVDPRE